MREGDGDGAKRRGGGCLAAGALFAVVFAAVWLAGVTAYGIVVEQWKMIRVRGDFDHDWVFLYSPLIALGFGAAAAFAVMRRGSAVRLTLLILTSGLIALFAGILFFGLGGMM